MPFPWMAAAVAGGALASYLGSKKANASAAAQQATNNALQHEFAQHGIRWKVADARAAGLHPLFALGGSGATYTPNPIVTESSPWAEAGQSLSRAVIAQGSDLDRELKMASIEREKAAAARDYALAAQADSEAARARQAASSAVAIPMPAASFEPIPSQALPAPDYRVVSEPPVVQHSSAGEDRIPGRFDVTQVKPSQVTSAASGSPYVAAGPAAPGSQRYRLTQNMEVLLPAAGNLGEALEPLAESWPMMWGWYQINVRHYGKEFTDLAFQELGLPVAALSGWRRLSSAWGPFDWSTRGLGRGVRAVPQPSGGAAFGVYPHMRR